MPLKFKIYKTFCYLVIALLAVLFIDLVFELTRDGITLSGPWWGLLLIVLFFVSYFMLPVLGIGFINDLNNNQEITKWKITLFWINFPIQLIFQLFIFYNTIDALQSWIELIYSGNYFSYRDLIPVGIGTLACILTIYLEIFSIPLIRQVKKNQRAILEQLNNLGSI